MCKIFSVIHGLAQSFFKLSVGKDQSGLITWDSEDHYLSPTDIVVTRKVSSQIALVVLIDNLLSLDHIKASLTHLSHSDFGYLNANCLLYS